MSINNYADNLTSAVRYALTTTCATTVCPFHPDVTVRVGDDAAESHAIARARKIIKTDGTKWEWEALMAEFKRQLIEAADGECPHCAHLRNPSSGVENQRSGAQIGRMAREQYESLLRCPMCGRTGLADMSDDKSHKTGDYDTRIESVTQGFEIKGKDVICSACQVSAL